MSEIPAGELLPSDRLREMVLNGEVTQLHRGDEHASNGDTFDIEGTTFEVTEVETERLSDLSDEDARAEGSSDLESYKQRIERTHRTEWDDDRTAVLHRFERR